MYKKVFTFFSLLFFIYYLILIINTGFAVTFNHIWAIAAIISFLFSIADSGRLKKLFSLLSAVLVLLTVFLVYPVFKDSYAEPLDDADYAIVLGAEVNKNNKPSKILKSRLDIAYDYLIENEDTKVIVTGAKGTNENISESLCMKEYLKEKGIDEKRILIEDDAENTSENIAFSAKLIPDENFSAVIFTSDFHLHRALMIAEKNGFKNVSGKGCKTDLYLLPNYYLRESIACIKEKFL